MINLSELLAVRAQLERDAVGSTATAAEVPAPERAKAPQLDTKVAYPSKRMVFENGQYRVAD